MIQQLKLKKIVFPLIVIVLLLIIITGLGIGSRQRHNTFKMLIVGDSIGEGAGASGPSLKWYKYLAPYMNEPYGIKLDITNVSMGGNSSYAGYARVMELDEGEDYDLAVICYGENDQIEDFSFYYESILKAVQDKYPACKLMTILESSQRDYTEKIKIIETLSAYYGAYVVDTIAAFRDSGRTYEELCDDGTHPNDEGQKVYYETVKEQLDIFLKQKDVSAVPVQKPYDLEVVNYTDFKYYSTDDFQKAGEYACELEMSIPAGRLGIDYTTVKGVNLITVYADGQKISEKEIGWDNDLSLRFIEVMSDKCKVDSKIRIEFSSPEQMEAFHGIIVNRYEELE